MVLVAAIAAGVLIDTAGFLQSESEETGQESSQQVTNRLQTAAGTVLVVAAAVAVLGLAIGEAVRLHALLALGSTGTLALAAAGARLHGDDRLTAGPLAPPPG